MNFNDTNDKEDLDLSEMSDTPEFHTLKASDKDVTVTTIDKGDTNIFRVRNKSSSDVQIDVYSAGTLASKFVAPRSGLSAEKIVTDVSPERLRVEVDNEALSVGDSDKAAKLVDDLDIDGKSYSSITVDKIVGMDSKELCKLLLSVDEYSRWQYAGNYFQIVVDVIARAITERIDHLGLAAQKGSRTQRLEAMRQLNKAEEAYSNLIDVCEYFIDYQMKPLANDQYKRDFTGVRYDIDKLLEEQKFAKTFDIVRESNRLLFNHQTVLAGAYSKSKDPGHVVKRGITDRGEVVYYSTYKKKEDTLHVVDGKGFKLAQDVIK